MKLKRNDYIQKNLESYSNQGFYELESDPAGTRTQGPYIKSVLLYQLSYRIINVLKNVSTNSGCKYINEF